MWILLKLLIKLADNINTKTTETVIIYSVIKYVNSTCANDITCT